ncbi:hypothetical protein [Photobacterium sp. DNB22_13_2]
MMMLVRGESAVFLGNATDMKKRQQRLLKACWPMSLGHRVFTLKPRKRPAT